MTMMDVAAGSLRPVLRQRRWLGRMYRWIRAELRAAEQDAKDEQFMATPKGTRYLALDLDKQLLHRR